jgi:hypothetical protein
MNRLAIPAIVATTLVASLTGTSANASGPCMSTHNIDAMRAREHARIEQGRQSGQLTWFEYRRLKAEQLRIAADERFAKIDGCVSPAEYRRIEQELQQASAHIHALKHNEQVAGRRDDHEGRRWYRRWW